MNKSQLQELRKNLTRKKWGLYRSLSTDRIVGF